MLLLFLSPIYVTLHIFLQVEDCFRVSSRQSYLLCIEINWLTRGFPFLFLIEL